jgi:hypothetical protein
MYPVICDDRPPDSEMFDSLVSVDIRRVDPKQLPRLLKQDGGTSSMNLLHMSQLVQSGKFADFDYGFKANY